MGKNQELMSLIREKCNYIRDIRQGNYGIEVQIPCMYPDSDISWIQLYQSPLPVEKIVKKWIYLGGKIE